MTLHLTDLTPAQIRLLARLDDGQPQEDSVGEMLRNIMDTRISSVCDLLAMGLIEYRRGWKSEPWIRLTEAGRRIRNEDEVS